MTAEARLSARLLPLPGAKGLASKGSAAAQAANNKLLRRQATSGLPRPLHKDIASAPGDDELAFRLKAAHNLYDILLCSLHV